ncbi:MAG: FecR domain-containing protein [Bacteroidetes bacterium]|nr:FecR domain-containing protein [Bacteroidota bacterium]
MASLDKYKDILGLVAFTDQIAIPAVDTQDAWMRLQTRMHVRRSHASSWWTAAAAVVILALTGYFLNRQPRNPELPSNTAPEMIRIVANEVVAPTTATLPDGSVVRLLQSSSLSYPAKFPDSQRRVELRGTATFAVAPNARQPFVVEVKDMEITVLGTSFTVNSDHDRTAIHVLSGLIQVTSPRFDVPLKAGEKLIITDSFWVKNTDTVEPGQQVLPPLDTPKPATMKPKPPTAMPKPAAATIKPATAASKPATTTLKPAAAAPKPATAATAKQPTGPVKPGAATIKPERPAIDDPVVNNVEHQRTLLRAIIKAFVDDHLVAGPDNVISFALTDESLTINGQQQSSSIHEKYKKSYIERPGLGFYFGPVTVTGTGIFMNRDDLFRN